MNKRYLLGTIALAVSSMLVPGIASAQDFPPKRPVTLFVGFAAGGAADAAARLIAKKLTENIGQNVVVENKAGAGGNIVHQQVANGVADGSVILLGSIGPMTIAPHMMKVGYDPFKDLAPISGGVNFPNMLVVNKESGIRNLADFVAMAKKAPDAVSFASTGAGSASHLTGELFAIRTNTDMLHVPYKGGAPAMQDLLANRFTGYFSAPPTSIANMLRYKLVVGRCSDSLSDIAGNSSGKPPASHTPRFTASATSFKDPLHGFNSDHVFAIPITGLPSKTSGA